MSGNRRCTVKILDEVNCVFIGLHPDHVGYFYEEFAYLAPNYYFNPKYKLGSWDGKIRYFHKTGKTHVYLLDDILPRVVGLGYKVNIIDERTSFPADPNPVDKDFFSHILKEDGEPWEFRDYQVDMVNALLANGGGVGIAGTGAGKTSICAAIARSYELAGNLRSIIIVPDKNLTEQTYREYGKFGIDVGEYSGDRKSIKHQHIVSTWQSLKNNPKLIQSFDVVIVDECHGLRGKELGKLLNEYGKNIPYRFGVTGTLPKEKTDRMAVTIAIGHVQYTIPAHQLIEEGHLAKLHIDIMQLKEEFKEEYEQYLLEYEELAVDEPPLTYMQFVDSYFPEWSAEKSYLQSREERIQWIVDYIGVKRDMGKGNVFCLVNGIKFGQKLAKQIDGAIFVYGKDRTEARKQVYDLFKEHDNLVVIATVNIASTGLDIPRIFNLIYIDVGRSFIRTIQSIGRALRKAHDKDAASITDICSNLKYSKRHVRERIKFYKEAKYPYKKRIVDYR